MIPKIGHYSQKTSGGTFVEIGNLTIWFSYKTPVAFQVGGHPRVISVNYWGSTTGGHINDIDPDKSKRVKSDEFEARLKDVVATIDDVLEGGLF